MNRTSFKRMLTILGTAIVIALIAAFAIWRSLDYARGPKIIVSSPENGSSITENAVEIRGIIERAKSLLLNGHEINIDEQGHFSENIIVMPGINLFTLTAKDQFGRSTETHLTLVGNNNAASTTP